MIFNKVNKLYSYQPNSDLEHFHHPNKIVQAHLEFTCPISKPTLGNYIWGRSGNPPTVDSPTVDISFLSQGNLLILHKNSFSSLP